MIKTNRFLKLSVKRQNAFISQSLAKVCDMLAEYVENKQKKKMLKYAEDFRAFAKLFRGGKHEKINKAANRR
jgi:hypothetical protein